MKHSILIGLFISLSIIASAQNYVKQEVIVMLQANATWAKFNQELRSTNFLSHFQQENEQNIELKKVLSERMKIALVQTPKNWKENEVIQELNKLSTVKATQLNYFAEYRREPNDTEYDKQWYLRKINAPNAWNTTTGGTSPNGDTIAVFIIDEGFDVNHEDLKDNIWVNYEEIPDNGIDEDGNGYVDDRQGWNLSNNSGVHLPANHGTQAAGVIGGIGNNNIGISGVNWNVKMIPFGILESDLVASNILEGYGYALDMRIRYNNSNGAEGAFIVATNFSAGFAGGFPESYTVFCEMYDKLGEEGILSVSSAPNDKNYDVQQNGDIPTLCPSSYLITVTGTDTADFRTGSFGNFAVDLAAPGRGLFMPKAIDNYGYDGGTSFAAPQVTGTIALLYSLDNELFGQALINNPLRTTRLVRDAILTGVERLDTLKRWTYTGGRLDIDSSLKVLNQYYEGWNESFKLVNAYPNPVDNILTVIYQSPNVGTFDFILFNSVGQNIFNQKVEAIEWGFRNVEVDMSAYDSGIYFLMLKSGQQIEITKIVVY